MKRTIRGAIIFLMALGAILALGIVGEQDRELYELEYGAATVELFR